MLVRPWLEGGWEGAPWEQRAEQRGVAESGEFRKSGKGQVLLQLKNLALSELIWA